MNLKEYLFKKEKTSCILECVYAINPSIGKEFLYITDFVLANYKTGMVMAFPTHDERDFDFLKNLIFQ